MDITYKELMNSLHRGFLDGSIHSKKEWLPQLLVNDQSEGVKFLTTLQRELSTCNSFWLSVAFVTTSGVAALMNTLLDLKEQGIQGKVLVSSYLFFTQPLALKRLLYFDNIELRIAVDCDFHSKGYLFKNGEVYDLIIGSSNLTAGALCSNKEWNLKVSAAPMSLIIESALREFKQEFVHAVKVDEAFIERYSEHYNKQQKANRQQTEFKALVQAIQKIEPNQMQIEALKSLASLRKEGADRALVISATGTGKTFLSAFDAQAFNPKRLLFVVHRHRIVKDALKTFKVIFGNSVTMGEYMGDEQDMHLQFVFSTIQTLSREDHLKRFSPDHFDYIVVDESHRAGAASYLRIIEHFKPRFLLGMTATPERTDGFDIFKLFHYNIAYEIRLHKALSVNILSPFHYYGVTDLTVNGEMIGDLTDFKLLEAKERINRVIEKAELYGCDNGKVRGLIFCSRKEECRSLSAGFNQRGYKTVALTGDNTEEERDIAIQLLEGDSKTEYLDYIFTVDIFNEGIDIPSVNQVIMLRPTQSAIIFVQQLGRGLRKTEGKDYLTVIDFIGNYANNFMVPIALYGDSSYNKDNLRKCLAYGSSTLPGPSTINFDRIAKEKLFEAINMANMHKKKDLEADYRLLKFKLGRIPMMMDMLEHGTRDPELYVQYAGSYFAYVEGIEESLRNQLNEREKKLLSFFSKEINNAKRLEESLLLRLLIQKKTVTITEFKDAIEQRYGYTPSDQTIDSTLRNINFEFSTERKNQQMQPVRAIYHFNIVNLEGSSISFHADFRSHLNHPLFLQYFVDSVNYSIARFSDNFKLENYNQGFVYYRKYTRKDVFRLLNWKQKPVEQNVGGYIISPDKTNCPIFVTYTKEDDIASTIKYEDRFLNNVDFEWFSKSGRRLNSPDVVTIKNHHQGLRIPLFIKKNDVEGTEFYYMGDVCPVEDSFKEEKMQDDRGSYIPVVKLLFKLDRPVEDGLYAYIVGE
jgi:superfamily II DNA or RNA helicase/HKD family nuclease